MVVNVAWPELRFTVAAVVAPSLKVTVPLGVPVEEGELSVTVAVNVTDEPEQIELAEVAIAVELLALLTVSVPLT